MKKDPYLLNEYKQYYRKVEIETRKSIKNHSDKIQDYDKRGYEYHLDHIYSILDGFNNSISPKIIGHWRNLRIISKFENESKGGRSDITIYELKELVRND